MLAAEPMKEQVVDTVPKRIEELKFGILSVVRLFLKFTSLNLLLARSKISSTRGCSKYVIGPCSILIGIEQLEQMVLWILVWVYRTRLASVTLVDKLCKFVMVTLDTFG